MKTQDLKHTKPLRKINKVCLADDSGLVIDALDGRPGILSARYGDTDDYTSKCRLILSEMQNQREFEKRSARFVCSLVLCLEGQEIVNRRTM